MADATPERTYVLISADRTVAFFLLQAFQVHSLKGHYLESVEGVETHLAQDGECVLVVDMALALEQIQQLAALVTEAVQHRRALCRVVGIRRDPTGPDALRDCGLIPQTYLPWPCRNEYIQALGLQDNKSDGSELSDAERIEMLTLACRAVSHTINNPLTVILGQAQMFQLHPVQDAERLGTIFRTIELEAGRIRDFLNRFEQIRAIVRTGRNPHGTVAKAFEALLTENERRTIYR